MIPALKNEVINVTNFFEWDGTSKDTLCGRQARWGFKQETLFLSGRQGRDLKKKVYLFWQAWWGLEQEYIFCLAGKVGILTGNSYLSGRQGRDLNRKVFFVWQARWGF